MKNRADTLLGQTLCSAIPSHAFIGGWFLNTEKAPTRALSWLKAATSAFTFKTLLRHYAKLALSPREVDVKLGC